MWGEIGCIDIFIEWWQIRLASVPTSKWAANMYFCLKNTNVWKTTLKWWIMDAKAQMLCFVSSGHWNCDLSCDWAGGFVHLALVLVIPGPGTLRDSWVDFRYYSLFWKINKGEQLRPVIKIAYVNNSHFIIDHKNHTLIGDLKMFNNLYKVYMSVHVCIVCSVIYKVSPILTLISWCMSVFFLLYFIRFETSVTYNSLR